ncbi:Methylated-DNA--protein-cysteine methyltransferase [Candidatus Nitrotoga sp. HW29]|uniref:methylated-DNA--[protein]-cysteine S-methyltransferase n=1 Tax=Candidatus Nitrotoga sp. HW29 TaxID=2886963 RepID=UPI001EF1DEB3|nr:methylated-DNA--[protein]-cysteine S-methyltransferase [Candidatus Nitrotoga sp. HW29]CAH1905150.1 Methylated-DNA--protein-cysteine methyltransferase [Candidatus Nitrotoga sp. HW29]
MNYQAKLPTPFGMLGICCEADTLTNINFLESAATLQLPSQAFAREVCRQLQAYFIDPNFHFNLSLKLNGTAHQTKVWRAISAIPLGQTRNYGDLATLLASSPRAVGQACGSNPIPIVIPCHRVISKSGIGGFIHQRGGNALDIKRWLLTYEKQSN